MFRKKTPSPIGTPSQRMQLAMENPPHSNFHPGGKNMDVYKVIDSMGLVYHVCNDFNEAAAMCLPGGRIEGYTLDGRSGYGCPYECLEWE